MFANLKKKIEEEVGDLGRLTSPINLTGALGDRRVGGSTQGTNTPSNLGSRQSSVASLIGLDVTSERTVQSRPVVLNSNHIAREPVSTEEQQQLKKQNADLKTKLEALKKSFEEKLQHQEADFAWKYNLKDDELTQLKSERDRIREQLKVTENSWQEKYMRVATELENLEGLSKQENAKVKHLLLNTQNDLQGALRRIAELESASKNKRDRDTANIMLVTGSDGSNVQTGEPELFAVNSSENSRDDSLLRRIKELEEENKNLKVSVEDAQKAQVALEDQCKIASEEIDHKIQETSALLLQLTQLEEKFEESKRLEVTRQGEEDNRIEDIRRLEGSLSDLKEMYENQTAQLEVSNDEKDYLQNQIKGLREVIDSKEAEITVLAKDQANRTHRMNALEQDFRLLKQAHEQKISEIEHLRLASDNLSAKTSEIVASDAKVKHTMESSLNSMLSELNDAKTAVNVLTVERNAAQNELEKLEKEQKIMVEEMSRFKQESSLEAEVLRNEVARLQELMSLLAKENQSLKDRLDSAVLLEAELKHLQREMQIFREEFSSTVPGANDILSSLGNTSTDLSTLRQLVLEQASIRTRLEEEVRLLKEKANAEVSCLQSKNEELVLGTMQELQETKAQLISEAENNQSLMKQVKSQENVMQDLIKKFEASCNALKDKELELEEATVTQNSSDAIVKDLQTRCTALQGTIDELLVTKRRYAAEVAGLNDQLHETLTRISELEKELENTKEDLRSRSSQREQESAELISLKKQLQKETGEYDEKRSELVNNLAKLSQQLDNMSKQLLEKEKENSMLQTKLELVSAHNVQMEEGMSSLETRTKDLENELLDLQSCLATITTESSEKSTRVAELEIQLEQRKAPIGGALSEAENTIVALKEDLRRQEIMITEESNKFLAVRRDLDKLNEQLMETKSLVTNLQDEKDSLQTQLEELSVLKSLAEEEAKTSSDRSAELYNEVTELKKSLRTNRQQLSELKKSVTKETRNDTSTSVPNNCSSVSSMEEVCLRDSFHHNESGAPYSEVNFLYLRSVLFKYLTASDPQVASSLVRVVATLLELKPEEEKLLKETQESQTRWFNSLMKK